MDEAHKSNGIHVGILTSCGSIRVFSRYELRIFMPALQANTFIMTDG